MNQCQCPGSGTMAHVRGCPRHPEYDARDVVTPPGYASGDDHG